MFNVYQRIKQYFSMLTKLKCINVFLFISGVQSHVKFIKPVRIRMLEKLKPSTQQRRVRRLIKDVSKYKPCLFHFLHS